MSKMIPETTRKMPPLDMLVRNEDRMQRTIDKAGTTTGWVRLSIEEYASLRRALVECRHEIERLRDAT